MRSNILKLFALVVCCALGLVSFIVLRQRNMPGTDSKVHRSNWNTVAAANYLESREVWWQRWPSAQMDHGTVCISCHTVVPYAMVQPALRQRLGEKDRTAPETAMLNSVEKRVTEWAQMAPFFSEAAGPGKAAESRATESVLNAVILANYDAADRHLRPVTRLAFDEAWALQEKTGDNAGGWKWQNFHLRPWESNESSYQGAALFAVALGSAPDGYLNDEGIRENVNRLEGYLRTKYASQPIMSQLYVLWASAKMPALLSDSDRAALTARIEELQRPDGGWALSTMDEADSWKKVLRARWNELTHPRRSDGCATGLAVLALQIHAANANEIVLQRGLNWLNQHQEDDGSWWATSLNGSYDPDSDIARFMQDAATGYAVLALDTAGIPGSTSGGAPQSKSSAVSEPPKTATY